MRTTVILNDDIYLKLIELFGRRGISKALNEFAAEQLFTTRKLKSMRGTLKRFSLDDVKIPDEEFE
ncbi:MAG: hypothetical protein V1722_05985 [Candidatus Micrarchaeota archaeon]